MLIFLGTHYFRSSKLSITLAVSFVKIRTYYFLQTVDVLICWNYYSEEQKTLSQLAMILHFLTFLALPQHGVSHLSQNCCFHFIVDDEGFFRWMHIYVASFYLPAMRKKKKYWLINLPEHRSVTMTCVLFCSDPKSKHCPPSTLCLIPHGCTKA